MTALRWARLLRGLGHQVAVQEDYTGEACDLLVALHARKSAGAVARFRDVHPKSPLVVALTGTDLYGDIRNGVEVARSLDLASRVVILQPRGADQVPEKRPLQGARDRAVGGARPRAASPAAARPSRSASSRTCAR